MAVRLGVYSNEQGAVMNDLHIYETETKQVAVRLEGDTVWLS